MRVASLLLIALAMGSGCEGGEAPPPSDELGGAPAAARQPSRTAAVVDSPAQPPRPGERWGGLLVEEADLHLDLVDSTGYVGRVRLAGEVTLSGRSEAHPFDSDIDDLCFFPDSASAARLPRFANDVRRSWVCFRNQAEARAALGAGPTDQATVVIDGFEYLYEHTDTYNTAELVRVIDPGHSP